MKYLNKYIDKGGDCGTLTIQDHHNEVKQYIDGHYFSASEAAWYIFQFHMHCQNRMEAEISEVRQRCGKIAGRYRKTEGTWLQLMCCALALESSVPNFGWCGKRT